MAAFSYRTGFFVVSIALGAALLALSRRGAAAEATSTTTIVSSVPSTATPGPTSTCAVELASCRAESWSVVTKAITSDVDTRSARVARAARAAGDDAPAIDTSGAAQKIVRCDVAEEQAREHWSKHKDEILATIKDVGTNAWIEKERKKELDGLEKTLGTNRVERERFDRGYDALWKELGPKLQADLTKTPQDIAALLRDVIAFWHGEDALVERVMGEHAVADFRASEMRSRTAIAAVLATLAGEAFDDAIVW